MNLSSKAVRFFAIISLVSAPILLASCKDDSNSTTVNNQSHDNNQNSETQIEEQSSIQIYALDNNVSLDEAEKQLHLMDRADEIYNKLAESVGEDYISSAYFNRGEDFGVSIRLVGNTEYNIKELLLDDGTVISIRATNGEKYNRQGIEDYIATLVAPINDTVKNVSAIKYEFASNSIVIGIDDSDSALGSTSRSLNSQINLDSLITDMKYEVQHGVKALEDIALIQRTVYAGGALTGAGTCTASFAGTVNNINGFLTATHCKNHTSYVGNDGASLSYNRNNIITDTSPNHEISFVPTPSHPIAGLLFNSESVEDTQALKVVGANTTPIRIGETFVCHFGRITKESCGYIKGKIPNNTQGGGCNSKYSSNSAINSQSCGQFFYIEGPSLKCDSGDSGGPVYTKNGNTALAYGIANSKTSYTGNVGCASLSFSPIDFAVSSYGFKLKTAS